MSLSDFEALRPGARTLLQVTSNLDLPDAVAQLMLGLGRAANDSGLALVDALQHKQRAFDLVDRTSGGGREPEQTAAEEFFGAALDYVERLTSLYAVTAAQYAVCAVETASRLVNGLPVVMPISLPIVPSDILRLAQIHVPLVQIPIGPVAGKWARRAQVENVGLATGHRLLQEAMAEVENPPQAFDVPDETPLRIQATTLEVEFPAALHDYAAGCAVVVALMARREQG